MRQDGPGTFSPHVNSVKTQEESLRERKLIVCHFLSYWLVERYSGLTVLQDCIQEGNRKTPTSQDNILQALSEERVIDDRQIRKYVCSLKLQKFQTKLCLINSKGRNSF